MRHLRCLRFAVCGLDGETGPDPNMASVPQQDHGADHHADPRDNDNYFLALGLLVAGFVLKKLSMRTQLRRFKSAYGCLPRVVRAVWRDLKDNLPQGTKIQHLFWALFFLKKYPDEGEMAALFKKDPVTVRKYVWMIIFGLQELKAEKVRFPTGEDCKLVFLVSVDGTDCRIQEPRPFDRTWFSQKFKGPAVKYEVALDVLTGRCAWINGPFKGGKSEITIFREEGLMDMIPDGHLAVADKGLRGEPSKVSFPNHLDPEEVAELKRRIRARQETFFARMKAFKSMSERFRHKPVLPKHKACFEAVAVLVQYGIDNGSPLFTL